MINSYVQNSSAMSTEDGSSSTAYGGPQPARRGTHVDDHVGSSSYYYRQPFRDALPSDEPRGTTATASAAAATRASVPSPHPRGDAVLADERNGAAARRSTSPPLCTRGAQPLSRALSTAEQEALLEATLPVSVRLASQGVAQVRPLGVYVRTGRGGANNVTRLVLVRLTDPADPFFLYELELLEDDYGAFKQRLELLVDFQGFPRYLVDTLRAIAEGESPNELSFVLSGNAAAAGVSDASRGTLRVLEPTAFKTVEHISLVLLRQGDVGLKKYLAERFQFYERAFRNTEASRAAVTTDLQEQLQQLRLANDELRDAVRKRDEEMRFASTDAEREQLAALSRLREQHAKEVSALREAYEKKLETHTRALEEKSQQLRDSTADKDAALTALRGRAAELEATVASLQSQLRSAQDADALKTRELETLREMNEELASFKAEATKAMSENELNYVTLTERLRGTATALQNREEKVAALQEHYEKQDAYIRILAEQNRQQAERVRETEKNLEKAHHIIATQLQTIKSGKERYHIASDQLRSQEALLQEKEGTLRRLHDDLSTSTTRIQELQRKNNELRDQLEKSDGAREQLVQEVRQTQQALVRLQQSTSVNGRHWGVLGSAYRAGSGAADDRLSATVAAAAAPPAATDFMRDFGTHSHLVGGSTAGYRSGGVSSAVGGSLRLPTNSVPLSGASLFRGSAASVSPCPMPASQERAGSAETAGLTEPHGRTSASSLAKTEPSPSPSHATTTAVAAAAMTADGRTPSVAKTVSLEKPWSAGERRTSPPLRGTPRSPGKGGDAIRSIYNDLAGKSFLNGEAASTAVAAGDAMQSAYF